MVNNIATTEIFQEPTTEPLTLQEVKTFLRIDGDSENDFIESTISAARKSAEKYMRVSIILQKIKVSFDEYIPRTFELPYGPVVSIDYVKTFDNKNNETIISADNYYLSSGNLSICFIKIPSGKKIEILYNAGFASDSQSVPDVIKQGMLCHIHYLYERNLENDGVPNSVKSFYNTYRKISL